MAPNRLLLCRDRLGRSVKQRRVTGLLNCAWVYVGTLTFHLIPPPRVEHEKTTSLRAAHKGWGSERNYQHVADLTTSISVKLPYHRFRPKALPQITTKNHNETCRIYICWFLGSFDHFLAQLPLQPCSKWTS